MSANFLNFFSKKLAYPLKNLFQFTSVAITKALDIYQY